jgi:drug/metabolite transporter (DMT)-like permease
VIDVLANALYLIATHHGPLSVVVTLSSLYPAGTVVLALAVLGERLSALQGAGIACALVAVLLIVGR